MIEREGKSSNWRSRKQKQMKDAEERGCAFAWLQRGQAGGIGLDKRTSRRIIQEASLVMSSLRTNVRKNVGWGYTNQPLEGQYK